MTNSLLFFVLGMLHILFLKSDTPITTIFSSIVLIFAIYAYISNSIKIELMVQEFELFYFIGIFALENFMVEKFIRMRLISIFGGLITLIGIFSLLITLCYIQIEKTNTPLKGPFILVRHPLHASFILFFIGSCIYLSAFGSLGLLIWYLRTHSENFKALDSSYSNNQEYLKQTYSGIPFLMSDSDQKKNK